MAREQFQTLTEPMYYILFSLLEERNGVDIMAAAAKISHNRVRIGPGTLYAMLPKLEAAGFIIQTRQSGRQKWYSISDAGRQMLANENMRMRQMMADADEVSVL